MTGKDFVERRKPKTGTMWSETFCDAVAEAFGAGVIEGVRISEETFAKGQHGTTLDSKPDRRAEMLELVVKMPTQTYQQGAFGMTGQFVDLTPDQQVARAAAILDAVDRSVNQTGYDSIDAEFDAWLVEERDRLMAMPKEELACEVFMRWRR
jgi:hypothetical protein